MFLKTVARGKKRIKQSILAKYGDVMDMHVYLSNKLVFAEKK